MNRAQKRNTFFAKNGYLILVLLLAFGLRVWQLDHQSLWWDEIKTVFRAQLTFESLLQDLLQKRGHVPFYFWLMRGWGQIGLSDFLVRYFSVLWGVAGVALLYRLGLLLNRQRCLAQTATFLLAISPFHIWYSQEARMYSMMPALITLGTIFLILGIRRPHYRYWVGYGLVMLTAVYTHYFAILILFTHTLFIILYLRTLQIKALYWFVTATVVGLGFSIYGLFIINNGGYGSATPGWIQTIRWFEPLLTILSFSAGRTIISTAAIPIILFILFLSGMSFGLIKAPQSKPNLSNGLINMWFFIPILLIFIVSLGINSSFSLYNDRYLIIALPAFLLLVADGFTKILTHFHMQKFRAVFLIVILGLTSYSLNNLYRGDQFARTDMHQLAMFLVGQVQEGDVIGGQSDVSLPLKFYGDSLMADLPFVELPINYSNQGEALLFGQVMEKQIGQTAVNHSRIWYISQTFNFSPHGFANAIQLPIDYRAQWLNKNLNQINSWEFPSIQLMLFSFPTEASGKNE